METAISTEDLTRRFGDVVAVDGLTLHVPRGIIFGFLGPNGSGKTTTIRLLLGLLEPTAGRAEVLGFDTQAQADRIRERTGALLEHTGLYERLSAHENLFFYARIYGLSVGERAARIEELLRHLGLWERRHDLVATWSRGMRQKLAVARALLHRPALIFLDEPSAGLDPVATAALHEDLSSLAAREGVTVFLTTHNLAEAERLCAQVGVIRQGRLLAVDSPANLRSQSGAPTIEVWGAGFGEEVLTTLRALPGVEGAEVQGSRLVIQAGEEVGTAAVNRILVMAGAEVSEIRRGQASLEDVFLTLVQEEQMGVPE